MISTNWCHVHHMDEKVPESTYRVCLECGHVYERGRDLVEAHNDVLAETIGEDEQFLAVDEAEDITACPTCGHDW